MGVLNRDGGGRRGLHYFGSAHEMTGSCIAESTSVPCRDMTSQKLHSLTCSAESLLLDTSEFNGCRMLNRCKHVSTSQLRMSLTLQGKLHKAP